MAYRKDCLNGPLIMEKIYELTKGEAIISTDVGQHQMWAAQHYKYKKPRTLLTSGGLGTMGYGLGAAIGAKVGCKDKTVINIAGDGCFRMNMNEVATATRYNIPVIEIIFNNHVLGMVRQWQAIRQLFWMIVWILSKCRKAWGQRATVSRQLRNLKQH